MLEIIVSILILFCDVSSKNIWFGSVKFTAWRRNLILDQDTEKVAVIHLPAIDEQAHVPT
jgi:hypothetical protein